jgi:hypothetical protein
MVRVEGVGCAMGEPGGPKNALLRFVFYGLRVESVDHTATPS